MLTGCVGTAGAGLDLPLVVQTVVVAGHDAIQDRFLVLASRIGVVVDHVHHHPQPALVQGLDHLPVLDDARGAIGLGAVATLRHGIVPGVVAPVKAVQVRILGDGCLLLVRIGWVGSQLLRIGRLPLGLVFVDGGDVEGWQQVQVCKPSRLQRLKVRHAVGVGQGEGLVGALELFRHQGVVDAKVADVNLVDTDVLWIG